MTHRTHRDVAAKCRAQLFDTSLGRCAMAWHDGGIARLQLPEETDVLTLARLGRGRKIQIEAPPEALLRVIVRIQRHLGGRPDPLHDVPLALDEQPPFAREVYASVRRVPPGRTISYAELARLAGRPGTARAVGQAMAQNPLPLLIPCHRVLASDGGLGGFSARGDVATKLRLLTVEGADLRPIARSGVRLLAGRDARLRRVIRRVGPYLLLDQQRSDPFTALAEAIVHQQVSMKAGATIFSRLVALVSRGGGPLLAEDLLLTPLEALRRAGISRQKASYLLDLAQRSVSGELPLARLERMDDDAVIQLLTRVKGIGRWSAEMFLMFWLGRLNVLPVDDLGLRKGAQSVYGLRSLPDADRLRRLARSWVPFRSIATWYLWRSLEAGGI